MKKSLAFPRTSSVLAAMLLVAPALPGLGVQQPPAGEAPAYEQQVNLVYTVNNLGYTETCG